MNFTTLFNYDFRHTVLNQMWRLVSGPLLLLFVPFYLSLEVQGYWYTFVSLAALAVFADMGFSSVLMLFSSYEFSRLRFSPDGRVAGEPVHLERISTLLLLAFKWTTVMAIVVFPIIFLIGVYVMDGRSAEVQWLVPWAIYGIASVLVFINSTLLAFIEGCNSVGNIQKIRLKVSVINVGVALLLLKLGFNLYSLACSLLLAASAGIILTLWQYRVMFLQLIKISQRQRHPWSMEVLPLLWRYSVSWISGYFIMSFFAPLAFHYYSAIEAGQAGLSMALGAAVFAVANVWITVITPKMNMLAARQEFEELDHIFFKHLLLAITTYILAVLVLYVLLKFFAADSGVADHLVGFESQVMLAVGWFFQLLVNALAVYMRAYKKEPLALLSLLNGIYVGCITWTIAILFPFNFFFLGFTTAYLWVVPSVLYIFIKYRRRRYAT